MNYAITLAFGFILGWLIAWRGYKQSYLLVDKRKLRGNRAQEELTTQRLSGLKPRTTER